ncbi:MULTISPECIES: DUF309 domain-containing protein [unclassified Prochlorococcus]|uniref:DUF309 domain-containing protein n=1 Tax=unclassified Prochlorococcus TaxID=2627481 RepID=UPI0005338F77|nr:MULTISPECIES: DUF309 domain-containing protein [unclassified Prochlorococcus]KGG15153.1 hypothetical protein EV06_1018 [Prochlorococcus sp. MIT 0602]KGG17425.1 hypothetical protein EV07_0864 [Prochlorococcus sp. MIT 0603]
MKRFSDDDLEFQHAVDLFNNQDWYIAHDAFEDIWHNTLGFERITVQAILQIAVAQIHLSNENLSGATILYGEAFGRLKNNKAHDLGLDMKSLMNVVEKRLKLLQEGEMLEKCSEPKLIKRII